MIETNEDPDVIVRRLNLVQITDMNIIEKAVDDVLSKNSAQVEQYKNGKTQLFGFFVGVTMRELKGNGSPTMINEILQKKLS